MHAIVVREEKNVKGLPLPNETRLVLTNELPDQRLITSAFVLAFHHNEVLLTHLNKRGWDIPGGHIEPMETPVEAMERELYEETGAVIDAPELLGYELIRLHGEKPKRYKYPYPDSYMVFYSAKIVRMEHFESTNESMGRGLFHPEQARTMPWVKDNRAFYEEALRRINTY